MIVIGRRRDNLVMKKVYSAPEDSGRKFLT